MKNRISAIVTFLIITILFAATSCQPNKVEIDGVVIVSQERIHLTVEIGGDPNSLVYQKSPAYGNAFPVGSGTYGSYTGQVIDGKGVLRVAVLDVTEDLPFVSRGDNFIIKFEDGKSVSLLQGDIVAISCVVDVELIGENPNQRERERVPEIDDCHWDGRLLNE